MVELELGGGDAFVFDTDVAAGTYKELEISIDKLEVGNPNEQALTEEYPSLADASVLVLVVLIEYAEDRGSAWVGSSQGQARSLQM